MASAATAGSTSNASRKRSKGADIIALQEVTRNFARNGGVDMVEGLAALLPDYFHAFGPAMDLDFGATDKRRTAAQQALPVRQHGAVALADRRLAQPALAAHARGFPAAICSAARWRRWSSRRRDRSGSIPSISTMSPSPSAPCRSATSRSAPSPMPARAARSAARPNTAFPSRRARRVSSSWATSTWTASRPNTC